MIVTVSIDNKNNIQEQKTRATMATNATVIVKLARAIGLCCIPAKDH